MNKNEIIQYAIIAIIIIAVIVFLEDSELKDTLIDIFNDSLAQMCLGFFFHILESKGS